MVSFWPFKGNDTSTASFEKTLSNLTSKITAGNVKRDTLRSNGRRYKAIWTLYSGFVYTIYAMIIILISGRSSWGPVEYSFITGGPVMIYFVRAAISIFYEYRVSSAQVRLNELNKQREAAIEKFKEATKYNTTQQLLEKYGAGPPSPSASPKDPSGVEKSRSQQNGPKNSPKNNVPARTSFPIPPTANIQRPSNSPKDELAFKGSQQTPLRTSTQSELAQPFDMDQNPTSSIPNAEEFAPNAFPVSPQYASGHTERWYDRIMDTLLGEDETRAANRIVLICSSCRLVNGQAPPGVKTLQELGKWRCASCGAWNGVEGEVEIIIKETTNELPKKDEKVAAPDEASPNDDT